MSAAYDPIVARALEQLIPGVASDPEKTLRRARVAAQGLRRRRGVRLRRTAILAFVVLALLTGAALAASRFDLLPWLDQSNRSTASFSIDDSRTYRGPAPEVLRCPQAGTGSFSCSVGTFPASTRRTYFATERVESQPKVTREEALRKLEAAERKGQIDQATAERFRRDLDAVGDDFFLGLALLTGVETLGGGGEQAPGRPGFELVPPAGVPMWIACQASEDGFRCHDLASSRNVAVGTPLYLLQASSDWVAVPRQSQRPIDVNRLFQAVLGRDLTPAEGRLLMDFATWGAGEGHTGTVHAEQVPPKSGTP
jgi:hypothetical protein